jgi:hypothetical protein
MSVAPPSGYNRIMIYGPKPDGTYIVEFRIANGDCLLEPASTHWRLNPLQRYQSLLMRADLGPMRCPTPSSVQVCLV